MSTFTILRNFLKIPNVPVCSYLHHICIYLLKHIYCCIALQSTYALQST